MPDATIGKVLAGRGGEEDGRLASALADGSLRTAILLIEEEGLEQYRDMARLLSGLPRLDAQAMHRFADRVAGRGSEGAYLAFLDHIRGWLARRVRHQAEPDDGAIPAGLTAVPLERWAEVWEKVNHSSDLAEALNLDRKQVVLSIFMTLARATRM